MITSFLSIFMKFFYNLFHNYGLAILFFTIVSKIILFPVSLLVQKNSIKLVSLRPKINRIKIDYYGDDDKITELESKLYKEEKYNPFLSVIPLIIQLVILICFVQIVNNPITYISNVDSKTRDLLVAEVSEESNYQELEVLRKVKNHEINNKELEKIDLEVFNYDLSLIPVNLHNYLFPLLAALSSLIYCLYDMKKNVLQREQSTRYKIITMLISVSLSLYLGLYVPSGVALYWIFSNLLAMVVLFLLNTVMKPTKYIDYSELEKSNAELATLTVEDRSKDVIKREKVDYKRFFKIDNKHLVIYAEDSGYYKYYRGIINYLLEHSNLIIHYITSDYSDPVLKENTEQFKAYYIGEKKLISLMMKMDSDIVLMTVPDLDKYHIKRSYVRKDIEYIFIHHGIGNYNCSCKKGSLDHFDTIFAFGKYQRKEITEGNKVYNLKRKVVDVGYPLLDEMLIEEKFKNNKTIIIAPSWQKDNIMETCIDEIINILKKNFKLIVRPHPYYVKHNKNKMKQLKDKYCNNKNVIIQDDYSTIGNILDSEILITDWSGISYEYAFITKRPVISINTPMRVLNKDYQELGIEIFELYSRDIIGKSIDLDKLNTIDKVAKDMIKNKAKYSKKIEDFFEENVYNIGTSSEVAAKYLVNSIQEKIKRRKHD